MITRRNFLKTSTASATTSALAFPFSPTLKDRPLLKPARLKSGSVVGIVSPGGATFVREQLNVVVDAVRGLGLVPRLAPHLLDRYGYLAGKDKDRAADINQFFAACFGFGQADDVQQLAVKTFVKAVAVVGERKF